MARNLHGTDLDEGPYVNCPVIRHQDLVCRQSGVDNNTLASRQGLDDLTAVRTLLGHQGRDRRFDEASGYLLETTR